MGGLETALFVARVVGVKRVVEILEAQPERIFDGCGRDRVKGQVESV